MNPSTRVLVHYRVERRHVQWNPKGHWSRCWRRNVYGDSGALLHGSDLHQETAQACAVVSRPFHMSGHQTCPRNPAVNVLQTPQSEC